MLVVMTRTEIANLIESFLDGSCGEWEWDDFIQTPLKDPEPEEFRRRCDRLPQEFPPTERGHYCGAEGFKVLKQIAADLRRG
jgi:hypothetical protein